MRPRALTLRAASTRDRRAPYRFALSGRLAMPAGTNGVVGCKGTVLISLRRGPAVIGRGRGPLRTRRGACVYNARVAAPASAVRGSRPARVTATARFGGNEVLLPRRSRGLRLRAG